MGGIGKSQLALHYAHSTAPALHAPSAPLSPSSPSLPTYALRAWFDASTAEHLQSAYLTFATTCLQLPSIERNSPPEDVRAAVRAWLDAHDSWLLVYDNVHAYEDVEPFLPSVPSSPLLLSSSSSSSSTFTSTSSPSSHCPARHLLLTSRKQEWPPAASVREVPVDERLTQAESVQLLVQLMHKRERRQLQECLQDAAYLALAAALRHYPLAISQAGAYLSQRREVQVSEYTQQCERLLLQHQLLPTGDVRRDRKRDTIAFTFLTSIDAVARDAQQQGLQPVGHALLTACAYLHPDAIPLALLQRWLQDEYPETLSATPDLLHATVSLLQSYSLLQLDVQRRRVRVHSVLQSAVRHLHGVEHPIDDAVVRDGRIVNASRRLQECVDRGRCTFAVTRKQYELQEWYGCTQCPLQAASPTAAPAAGPSQRPSYGCCAVCARTCHAGHTLTGPYFTTFFCDCGAGELVQPCNFISQTAVVDLRDGDTPSLLPSAAAIGRLSLSWYLLLMQATVTGYLREGAGRVDCLPHLDELQRRYYTHLAPLLRAAGKPCPDVVVYALLALGEGRLDFLVPVSPLATLPPHLSSTLSQSSKAALLQCLLEYEQLPHLHSSPTFYLLFLYLADLSHHEGRQEEALVYVQRAHQLRDALPAGSVSASDQANLVLLLKWIAKKMGRRGGEVLVCERMLALSKQYFAGDEYVPQQVGIPHSLYSLALAYGRAGRHAERAELLRCALLLCEDYRQRHADAPVSDHLQPLMFLTRAQLVVKSADVEDLAALQQQLTTQQLLHGHDSIQCARTWDFIVDYHRQAGHYQLAVEAATEALRIRQVVYGPQHRDLIGPLRWLGDVHRQWGERGLAVAAYKRAVNISRQQHDDADHRRVANIQLGIADCCRQQRQWQEAKRWYSEALPVIEATMPNGRKLARLRWSLYTVLRRLGEDRARQAELLRGALDIHSELGDTAAAEKMRIELRRVEGWLPHLPQFLQLPCCIS